jgi:hypothetical protein
MQITFRNARAGTIGNLRRAFRDAWQDDSGAHAMPVAAVDFTVSTSILRGRDGRPRASANKCDVGGPPPSAELRGAGRA